MQHHRILKSIFIGLCLVSLVAGGLIAIVGSGGGGGSSRTPLGAVRVLNDLPTCGGNIFTVRATIGGRQLFTTNGSWSACAQLAPGTYRIDFRFICGGIIDRFTNVTINDFCTLSIRYFLAGGALRVQLTQNCPGVCPVGDVDGDMSLESSEGEVQELVLFGGEDDPDIEIFK